MRRFVLAGLVLVVVLAVLGAGGLYWFLSGDGSRAALERQATAWLGQPVHVAAARVAFLPRVAIRLDGVSIGEPVRVTLSEVAVSTGLRALLKRRIADAAALAAFGGAADTISGTLSGEGTFSGSGGDLAEVLGNAHGSGKAEIVGGTIQRLGLVRTVVLFFGRPAPDAAATTDAFSRMDLQFSLARQLFTADAFSLRSPDADILGTGALAVPTKALSGRFDLMLSEDLSAQAGTNLARYTREGNRVVLPTTLGGTLEQPRPTIDAAAALKRGLRNAVQERLKGLLGGGRPSQPQRWATRATMARPTEPPGLLPCLECPVPHEAIRQGSVASIERLIKLMCGTGVSGGSHHEQTGIPFDLGARVRDVREGPDGLLYFVTDEEVGRLMRIEPAD